MSSSAARGATEGETAGAPAAVEKNAPFRKTLRGVILRAIVVCAESLIRGEKGGRESARVVCERQRGTTKGDAGPRERASKARPAAPHAHARARIPSPASSPSPDLPLNPPASHR